MAVFVMSRSPAISTLLILTLCIVCEVTSAPKEERIREESEGEKFLETREAEVLERRSEASTYENFGESREEEMRNKRMTIVQSPVPSVNVEKKRSVTKKPIVDKSKDGSTSIAENSEAKDMRQTHVDPKDDDDSADAETVPKSTEKNSTRVGQRTNKIPDNGGVYKVEESKKEINETSAVEGSESPIVKVVTLSTVSTNTSTIANVTSEPSTKSPVTPASSTKTSTAAATDSPAANTTDAPTTTTMNASTTTTTNAPTTTTMIAPTTITINAPTTTTMKTSTAASTSISTEAVTSPGTSAVTTTSSSTNSPSTTNASMTSSSTETYSGAAEAALHAKHSTSMPAGVVALVIAIAFACVSVIAYIALVVWRRYLEWRYGNRELLVNEFDANDISNFEL